MLQFIIKRLFGSLVVIWVIITISFFLMRFAPGSPFDADKALPPAVEAQKWIAFDMGVAVDSPVTGKVVAIGDVSAGQDYEAGVLLAKIEDKHGTVHDVVMPTDGKLVQFPAAKDMEVFGGDTTTKVDVPATQFGMGPRGLPVVSAATGSVTEVAALEIGKTYPKDTLVLVVTDGAGKRHEVRLIAEGALTKFAAKVGQAVEGGDRQRDEPVPATRLAVVPKSLFSQYLSALGNYATLDFGVTLDSGGRVSVAENLAKGFPISMQLGLWALVLAFIFGVGAGFIAGVKQNTWVDYTLMSGAMVGISVPVIVSGPLFLLIFVEELGWFDYAGWENLDQKILPIFTLALVYTASFSRLARGGMLEVIRSDYIRTARAKGLDERTVVMRHAFKGALLPSVSYMGPAIARIVTGSVVVERIFAVPGLSEHFVTPAINRDYPMVIGVVVLYSALLVFMNLVVDVLYTVLDPRVTYD